MFQCVVLGYKICSNILSLDTKYVSMCCSWIQNIFHHVVREYKICSSMLPLDTVMVRNLIRNKTFYFAFNENNSVTSLELGYIVGQLAPPKSHMVF